ncbi:MAG: DNA gyrase/topoisomerase IV subunit A [Bacteroidales bacterium]|nr:DNA gyrase/topoisomerase IV subunit A [Bacteroidales bacterium]
MDETFNPDITPQEEQVFSIKGMYQNWFLDYASYVILERAVPHLDDGLKPVQRRILHTMKTLEDGRYNKVANIIGQTMQYHPHGDASIGDALVNLGQKDLLIDTQGNWGNIFTGDGAAAPRYIEARLSKFALDVVFNPKTTEWKLSYDGRKKEPITLPIKFPLLLAQGAEGIAVGLASKILPHNFNELLDASIAYLRHEEFALYPDFPTGGLIDVSKYNDGKRGGSVRIRAVIRKADSKTLVIDEIPYGKTSGGIIESILKANERGKIKIKKIDDNTSDRASIVIHLAAGVSPDKTIDALYALTDCEINISNNCCTIWKNKPNLMSISEMLKFSTDRTVELLRQELQIRLGELENDWHYSSLEKIFFEEGIYKELENKEYETWDAQLTGIERRFDPYRQLLQREILREDVEKLCEKPIRKISKFDIKKADEHIKAVEAEMAQVKRDLRHLTDYAIRYFEHIKEKYGADRQRKTVIQNFDTIEATKVVMANEKLYINREEGFVGYGLKRDEYICDCSDMDDIIVVHKDGTYVVSKVSEKAFFGKNIIYANVFKKNDTRTIYNVVYRNGKNGVNLMKRCAVTGVTRDKVYDFTQGVEGSTILYFSANPNGEGEILRVVLRPVAHVRRTHIEVDLSDLAIKGRGARGNVLTKYPIQRIALKEKGASTLGGTNIYWDSAVNRINSDGHGQFVGEMHGDDQLLVITSDALYRTTSYDLTQRFETNVSRIEPFDPDRIYTAVYFNDEQDYYYLKRFPFEAVATPVPFIAEDGHCSLVLLSSALQPRFRITFGGKHAAREPEIVEAENFIGVKSLRAKGKRLTNFTVETIEEIEPEEEDLPDSPDIETEPDMEAPETAQPAFEEEPAEPETAQPETEAASAEEPAVEEPIAEEPAAEAPKAEEAVAEERATKESAAKDEASKTEDPKAEEPPVKKTATKKPAAKKATGKKAANTGKDAEPAADTEPFEMLDTDTPAGEETDATTIAETQASDREPVTDHYPEIRTVVRKGGDDHQEEELLLDWE